ncbi:MAG: DUF427 domain-containing protein, partial [Pseudomonadota bacterium]
MTLPIENVQSYPRPPALEPVPQRLTIRFGKQVIADTVAALRVLETHHAPTYYLPPSDITATLTRASNGSFCEWKGQARYWTVTAGDAVANAAAWSYPDPSPRFAELKDHVAFYAGQMDACYVGDV